MRTTTLTAVEGRAAQLLARFRAVRARTLRLCEPLSPEDCVAQSMPDASPVKWHLAHTAWFFEEFVLCPGRPGYRRFHPSFAFLFNSYYEAVGARHARPARGMLTRPSLAEVGAYRAHVDAAVAELCAGAPPAELLDALELGLNHEEQHQELLLTDALHLLSLNPLEPAYQPRAPRPLREVGAAGSSAPPPAFHAFDEGVYWIGVDGERGFAFDNEGPRHRVFLDAFELATRPVTNAEFAEFVEGGGYSEARWWLSAGWDWVRAAGVDAPLYWRRDRERWSAFTLAGRQPLEDDEPVAHVSFYEADAYARYCGARLPTEAEWEVGAADLGRPGVMRGAVWEWTASPYVAYPGYRPAAGALGEYNGKFMCDQLVLRGGSSATPPGHVRATYRNFFPAATRWQFSGIRLARDSRRGT
jgi:ergothioneine biosynthesis protein EgtB